MPRLDYIKRICEEQVNEAGIMGVRVGVNSKRRFRSYEIFVHFNGRVRKLLMPWKDAEWVKKEVLSAKIFDIIGDVIYDRVFVRSNDT